ncbi:MAG TPA: hypothetical protein PKG90_10735 [Chitinophagaceae bacterium]|nr:hypothetical protein [Chitinophagaceae bacterium]HNU15653.1 hypothetical protein [Chitinophagaceae bacterium]
MVFTACSKGGTTIEEPGGGPHVVTTSDTTQPILDIYTPVNDESFTGGELIKEQLYEIHGNRLYNFSVSHIASVTALTNCTVTDFLRIMA